MTTLTIAPDVPFIKFNPIWDALAPYFNCSLDQLTNIQIDFPDFSTLGLRSFNFEKAIYSICTETMQTAFSSFALIKPMAELLGQNLEALFPAIPGIASATFLDLLNSMPDVMGAITSLGSGFSFSSMQAEIKSGLSTINLIINEIQDKLANGFDFSVLLQTVLDPVFLIFENYDWSALIVFQAIMKEYNTVLISIIMNLIQEIIDTFSLGSFSIPIMPNKDTLLALLEANMMSLIPGMNVLVTLFGPIGQLLGNTISGVRELFLQLPQIKSISEMKLKILLAKLKSLNIESTINGLLDIPNIQDLVDTLMPGLPNVEMLIQLYNLTSAIPLPFSLPDLFTIDVPGFGEIFDFVEKFAPMGSMEGYFGNFTTAAGNAIRFFEYEFNKAWEALIGTLTFQSFTLILDYVLDQIAPLIGFVFPLIGFSFEIC